MITTKNTNRTVVRDNPKRVLMEGDCLERMLEIPDGIVDMILCDLPYGITANKWDSVIPFDQLWKQYLRVLKPTGAIVLTASQPFTSALVLSQPKLFKHEWIWIKNRGSNFANTVREPFKEHESVLVFSRGKWTYNKQLQKRAAGGMSKVGTSRMEKSSKSSNYAGNGFKDRYARTTEEYRHPASYQMFNIETGLHPTQKPLALITYLVRTYSNEGDTVMDNCMGSGTTGLACLHTNRKFIGIEQNPKYFDVCVDRIRGRKLV